MKGLKCLNCLSGLKSWRGAGETPTPPVGIVFALHSHEKIKTVELVIQANV